MICPSESGIALLRCEIPQDAFNRSRPGVVCLSPFLGLEQTGCSRYLHEVSRT